MHTEQELAKMGLRKLERIMEHCHEGSMTWAIVSPYYRSRLARYERSRTLIFFTVATILALASFIWSVIR